ncbi:MAG: DUF1549 domain-containing protein [Planctomycetes bacterium]|nr:DUF1549 domain-containing protein [Planctomycetota bacterium]
MKIAIAMTFAAVLSLVAPACLADAPIDFSTQIKPLLREHCTKCHAGPKRKGGFSFDSPHSVLEGGESGPAAVVGNADKSLIIKLVSATDPDDRMPAKGDPLTADQIALLKAWINQGMTWEAGFTFAPVYPIAPLAPRKPDLPGADVNINPIDRLLAPYFAEHHVALAPVLDDHAFARRVGLDLVGLIPSPAELAAFEADKSPDKRAKLVEKLLADRDNYAVHWMTFWNDALRNAYRGTGFIDGGRRQITGWLYQSLYDNMPYDQFVRELIDPVDGSEGFIRGIVWRGVVNASQRPEMQAAQNIGQVFMGTNLKCASCHDSFVNQWKLDQSYALASVFADQPLEIHRCDKPTGKISRVGFLFSELGDIDAKAPKAERIRELAKLVTAPGNGRTGRTMVNRLWAMLMGRGIVEPVDDMDQPPFDADVLDYLASDLADHGYDLKRTLTLICTSRVYQSAAIAPPDDNTYVFRGPIVRRMDAEQFVDAVSTLTDQWQRVTPDMTKANGGNGKGGQLAAIMSARGAAKTDEPLTGRWVWDDAKLAMRDPGGRVYLRTVLKLDKAPTRAPAAMTCDNQFTLYINGEKVAESDEWQKPVHLDLAKHLKAGNNIIAVEATNWPDKEHKLGLQFTEPNGAGFVLAMAGYEGEQRAWTLLSDDQWLCSRVAAPRWLSADFDASAWKQVQVIEADKALWKLGDQLAVGSPAKAPDHVRAAIAYDTPLLVAMGRPNREQVVTRRDTLATTLEALELTNGATLDAMLHAGADHILHDVGDDAAKLVSAIYQRALGREPSAAERAAAMEIVGSPATSQGVADLMWAIVMLPEFQLLP